MHIFNYRGFSQVRSISHYITTPIFYANSSPHIGHVHTFLLADALNVYQRLKSGCKDTIFSTGTDEHGIKIQNAANAANVSYDQFCDQNSQKFRLLFDQYDSTLTHFMRTTDTRHKDAVRSIWKELTERGFIYKSSYSGWYCSSDETFVPESQVTKREVNGVEAHFDQNDNMVHWSDEENYMFRLNDVKEKIFDWLRTKRPVIPAKFNDEACDLASRSSIRDISISRPVSRLEWGIRVPDDPSQTIYVWLDALTNYLTVAGYPCPRKELIRWPIDCQVIGKDIIKFHTIYWPAFLIALSLPLPEKLVCHSHWLIDSYKMSKSRGNVVDPDEENRSLTTEGLRYFLLRSATPHSDNDYCREQALNRVNAELADTYGNLMSRCCGVAINPKQHIPVTLTRNADPVVQELKSRLNELASKCQQHFDEADFYKGVDEIMSVLRFNNGLYENAKPWKLVKEIDTDLESMEKYTNLQAITFETLRVCSILLQPIIPMLANRALDRLNVKLRNWSDAKVEIDYGDLNIKYRPLCNSSNSVLFRRLNR